jgi:pimeloyl-ACP methyl ester carboxylesterase
MSTARTVVLTLPGMTLNETEFPRFSVPTLSLSYRALFDCPEDSVARAAGMEPYVRGLRDWLATRLAWQRADVRIVVGHSFGALLALSWLSASPNEKVDGLVTIGASPGPLVRRVRLRLGKHVRVPLAPILPLWNTRLVTRAVKRLCSGGRLDAEQVDFRALDKCSDAAVDRAGWRNVEWQRLRAMRLAMWGFDVRGSLHRILARTIVLHGDRDSLFDTEDARYLATEIPGAELRLVQGAGHGLPVSHPESVLAAVRDIGAALERTRQREATAESVPAAP